jgi:hypothetical protein
MEELLKTLNTEHPINKVTATLSLRAVRYRMLAVGGWLFI